MAASTSATAIPEGHSAFMQLLGAHFDEARGDRVTGWFEVGADHHQPWGLVHGGVFSAIIETFATVGAYLAVKDRGQLAVGVTNVTDFLRPQRAGRLSVVAEPVQQGRSQQLWPGCHRPRRGRQSGGSGSGAAAERRGVLAALRRLPAGAGRTMSANMTASC